MHYFCSLISFLILFRNTVFVVSILEMRHYKLSMNSCIRNFFKVCLIPLYQYLVAKLNNSVGEYILRDGLAHKYLRGNDQL